MKSIPKYNFRIHPAIGLARVGNTEEYYLGPETMAGMPVPGSRNKTIKGGLPIKPGTENEMITSSDLRDKNGGFKRQAARFKIFQYPERGKEKYPNGGGVEIQIGSKVAGKKVTDIIWMVHVANKKANTFVLENPDLTPSENILDGFKNGKLPPLRNLQEGDDPKNASRIRKLTIDPGPRVIQGGNADPVKFDRDTLAAFWDNNTKKVVESPSYPKSFPEDSFSRLHCPVGNIDTLGELRTDEHGRLLVLGGYGKACAWYDGDKPFPMPDPVDNDGWFDDCSDGPVSAVLVLDGKTYVDVHGAWVVSTDPSYAPQTLNVVSLWDDIYDSWIRKLELEPEVFNRRFQDGFHPGFADDVDPIFQAAALQQWNTNLPDIAISAHQRVGQIKGKDDPDKTIMAGLAFIRNPNNEGEHDTGAPLMPLSLGDQGQAFLAPTFTQYFFLEQWNAKKFKPGTRQKLGPGEYLDKVILANCLGGRFSPGIDLTYIVRQPDLYIKNWETSGTGPFRIKPMPLDYYSAQASQPFLGEGYVPLHTGNVGLEPGDCSKFLAIPWHADYNSCAIHPTEPNPLNSTTLYWSWPAQRPVAVYAAKDVKDGKLGDQRFSVRGKGTETDDLASAGRYQSYEEFVPNWHKVGIIIQGSAIDGPEKFNPDYYLEVESLLDVPPVEPWPLNANPE